MKRPLFTLPALLVGGVFVALLLVALIGRPSGKVYSVPQLIRAWTYSGAAWTGRTISVDGAVTTICDGADPTNTSGTCPGILRYEFWDGQAPPQATTGGTPQRLQVRFAASGGRWAWLRRVPLVGGALQALLTPHGDGVGIYQLRLLRAAPCPPFEPAPIPAPPRCIGALIIDGPP